MEACSYARRILDAIKDETIIVDNKTRTLKNHNGEIEIIL